MNRRTFAKKVGNYNRKKILFILPFVVIIIAALILGFTIKKPQESQKTYIDQSQNETKDVLGTSVTNESVEAKVENIITQNGSDNNNKRKTIKLAITNNSGEVLQFSPGLDLSLVLDDGTDYLPTTKFISVDKVVGGPISAGDSATFDIDFEVPNSINPDKLIYKIESNNEKLEISL